MDYLRNVKDGIRPKSKTFSHKPVEWDSEVNVTVREIQRLALRILESAPLPLEQKEEAIVQMGHLAYVGGRDATKAAAAYMPHFLNILKTAEHHHTMISIKVATLKSLSEICHGNRLAKEFMIQETDAVQTFTALIGNVNSSQEVRVGRWTCYLLALVISGLPTLMDILVSKEDLKEALSCAADYRRPWTGWGMNWAELLLKLLYHRDPNEAVSIL